MNHITSKIGKLLSSKRINATSVRIQVLEILLSIPDIEFTPSEILAIVKKNLPSVSLSAINSTLHLFKFRKIISQVYESQSALRSGRRGRPEAWFIYTHNSENQSTTKNEFLVLDDRGWMTMVSLMKKSKDFFILDEADQKIFVWLLINSPKKLRSWIEYLTLDYSNRKAISLDPTKLLNEAEVFNENSLLTLC